ncbi:hypothetical protein ON010_g11162 [Phytophthora cinnamomi]|nr:hypothetical protein ON010_g11162 [Phytophthora cinnamomi]
MKPVTHASAPVPSAGSPSPGRSMPSQMPSGGVNRSVMNRSVARSARTSDELWEWLQITKRERRESVEEWGDRVSDLCDSLDNPNPQMRYQLFQRGLRNKRMLATFDSGPARDIPEACEWLLAKELSRPIEEDNEFSEEKTSSTGGASATTGTAASLDALTEQMNSRTRCGITCRMFQQLRHVLEPEGTVRLGTVIPPEGYGWGLTPVRKKEYLCADGVAMVGIHVRPAVGRRCRATGAAVNGSKGGNRDRDVKVGTVPAMNVCVVLSREQTRTVPVMREASGGEKKKKKVGLKMIGTEEEGDNAVVNFGEKEVERVYKLVASAPVNEAVDGVDDGSVTSGEEVPGTRANVLEVKASSLVSAEEPAKGLDNEQECGSKMTTSEEDAMPLDGWEDEEYDVSDSLFAAWTVEETVTAKEVTKGTVHPEPKPGLGHDRLFSDEELDAMEQCEPGQEAAVLAGTERHVTKNAETQEEPSSEELARFLGVSMEELERTRPASSESHGSPEYWQDQNGDMLEKSEEAKRTNRDFSNPVASVTQGGCAVARDLGEPSRCFEEKGVTMPDSETSSHDEGTVVRDTATMESVVQENIASLLEDRVEEISVEEVDPGPVVGSVRHVDPKILRSIARQAVCRTLKKVLDYGDHRDGLENLENGEGGTDEVPPLRDKVPPCDEDWLSWHADRIGKQYGVSERYDEDVRTQIKVYFDENAGQIWKKLWYRRGRSRTASAKRRRRRLPAKLECLGFASLFKPYAEILDDKELFPEHDANIERRIRKGTVVACTSVIPESAFGPLPEASSEKMASECKETKDGSVVATSEEHVENVGEKVKATKPDIPPDKNEGMVTDFSEPKLSLEQRELFQAELDGFPAMFVELKKPGRTDLLRFEIDAGASTPIEQQPCRDSLKEGTWRFRIVTLRYITSLTAYGEGPVHRVASRRQQADRLIEVFWRTGRCIGERKPVRALSGLRAQQHALRAKRRESAKDIRVFGEKSARRGRRVFSLGACLE